jgi:hypothetical protein
LKKERIGLGLKQRQRTPVAGFGKQDCCRQIFAAAHPCPLPTIGLLVAIAKIGSFLINERILCFHKKFDNKMIDFF